MLRARYPIVCPPYRAGLLPDRFSQHVVYALLPARPLLLKMLKNVSIDAQRNEFFRIRGRWLFWQLWSFRRSCFECPLGCFPRIRCSSCLICHFHSLTKIVRKSAQDAKQCSSQAFLLACSSSSQSHSHCDCSCLTNRKTESGADG